MLSYQQINDLSIEIPVSYRGLDSFREIEIYWKNLPHWRQEGATYLVTFRQNDSIPAEIWDRMVHESKLWMSRIQKSGDQPDPNLEKEFLEFQRRLAIKMDAILDEGRGSCLLKGEEARHIVETSLLWFDETRYDIFAYAVMPNHVHVLVRPAERHSLESTIKSWKSYTSPKLNAVRNSRSKVWQSNYHDRIIRDEDHFRNSVRYILKNPLKANLSSEKASVFFRDGFENRRFELGFRRDNLNGGWALETDTEVGSPYSKN